MLIERGAKLVGLDTPSPDPVAPMGFPVHRALLRAGIPIVEGLWNLGRLAEMERPCWFSAFPLAIEGIEGCPVRAVAITRKE